MEDCFEVLPVSICVYSAPSCFGGLACPSAPQQTGKAAGVYAWRIIGGFDNHSHTPKTNAITKLIVFKVEAGSGRSQQS